MDEVSRCLEKRRQQLAEEVPVRAQHFRTTVWGGAWAKANVGDPFDAVKVYASGASAHR
jgi:hypothetical protein